MITLSVSHDPHIKRYLNQSNSLNQLIDTRNLAPQCRVIQVLSSAAQLGLEPRTSG